MKQAVANQAVSYHFKRRAYTYAPAHNGAWDGSVCGQGGHQQGLVHKHEQGAEVGAAGSRAVLTLSRPGLLRAVQRSSCVP